MTRSTKTNSNLWLAQEAQLHWINTNGIVQATEFLPNYLMNLSWQIHEFDREQINLRIEIYWLDTAY